ncbi:MAG: hypothetical protein FLDDKLPJ_02021 [Phycisphaerae bacterium]|nr:hypothetical protein [Phycisphaerae bacterium]
MTSSARRRGGRKPRSGHRAGDATRRTSGKKSGKRSVRQGGRNARRGAAAQTGRRRVRRVTAAARGRSLTRAGRDPTAHDKAGRLPSRGAKPRTAARRLGANPRLTYAAGLANALGHAARLRILSRLLTGPATYQALCAAAGHAAGPLYHHVRTLATFDLMYRFERDEYRITSLGRTLLRTWLKTASGIARSGRGGKRS